MTDHMRPASFLPTIKCSSCSEEIEIQYMGEHVCSTNPRKESISSGANEGQVHNSSSRPRAYEGSNFLSVKPFKKEPPRRIDPSTANQPFTGQSHSPFSETYGNDDLKSPSFFRSDSYPPPSPRHDIPSSSQQSDELPPPVPSKSNIDCAFPPFPINSARGPPTPLKDHPERRREEALRSETHPMYAPVSPRFGGGGSVLKRMNTIAPGPFGVRGRGVSSAKDTEKGVSGHQRTGTMGSSSSSGSGSNRSTLDRQASDANPMLKRSKTDRIGGFGGYGGRGATHEIQEGLAHVVPDQRSQVFPTRNASHANGDVLLTSLPNSSTKSYGEQQPHPSVPRLDSSRAAPSSANDYGIGNPYHTSTESQSSNGSYGSDGRTASSRSSPPLSETSGKGTGAYRKANQLDSLMDDIKESIEPVQLQQEQNRDLSPSTAQPGRSPYGGDSWANRNGSAPESPMDPAMRGGFVSRELQPTPPKSPLATQQSKPPPQPRERQMSSKGNCRGCGQQIKGKSISSADGRLTGRFHKDCFVCKDCKIPFETAEFYVINDHPYCERHYHQLNNSLCQSCDQGIEGQYLETDKKQKFHPRCLKCSDCREILHDDYFEMNGKIYCERHAMRTAQQTTFLGPGARKNPERRTTRLMMMI